MTEKDLARQLLELREAVRALVVSLPPGRRHGKQASMQARHTHAATQLVRHLPEHAEKSNA